MPATKNWDFRSRKFRLQAYWAETRTPGAGNMPQALGGRPRFWPTSVLCLNSEPVSKRSGWNCPLTLRIGKIKSPLAKSLFLCGLACRPLEQDWPLGCHGPPPQLPVRPPSGGWHRVGGRGDSLIQIIALTRKLAGKQNSGGA